MMNRLPAAAESLTDESHLDSHNGNEHCVALTAISARDRLSSDVAGMPNY